MAEHRDIPFPVEEYRTRLTSVQERMRSRDIDILLAYTPENINYLTGYNTTGYYVYQCLLVPADRDPIMVTRELETDNVTMGTWLDDYRIFSDTEDPVVRSPATPSPSLATPTNASASSPLPGSSNSATTSRPSPSSPTPRSRTAATSSKRAEL